MPRLYILIVRTLFFPGDLSAAGLPTLCGECGLTTFLNMAEGTGGCLAALLRGGCASSDGYEGFASHLVSQSLSLCRERSSCGRLQTPCVVESCVRRQAKQTVVMALAKPGGAVLSAQPAITSKSSPSVAANHFVLSPQCAAQTS